VPTDSGSGPETSSPGPSGRRVESCDPELVERTEACGGTPGRPVEAGQVTAAEEPHGVEIDGALGEQVPASND
jgi:hypothetical protein